MKANINTELVQRLKELNALIVSHINKVKEDIVLLDNAMQIKQPAPTKAALAVPGTKELASGWRQSLN